MSASWLLNIIGHYATTVGALLIFLYLWRSPRFAEDWLSPDGKRAYMKHRRLLIIAVGLLAARLITEYVSVIVLS